MTTLSPINAHISALNRAYAHIDNAIAACDTKSDCIALLDQIEAQCGLPYMDILYQHAAEIIGVKIKTLN